MNPNSRDILWCPPFVLWLSVELSRHPGHILRTGLGGGGRGARDGRHRTRRLQRLLLGFVDRPVPGLFNLFLNIISMLFHEVIVFIRCGE